jgi:hypothetical protein
MTVTVGVSDKENTKSQAKNEDSLTAFQLKVSFFLIFIMNMKLGDFNASHVLKN